ncbi:hypothetical protein ACJ73_09020 [Blastomyces percursus]|uniref:Uncharacterized protein n=1 Tax=Blastomyces percursus TaxID=1658174 RepID=A0A1J9Q481_9EURO|nr:hypothetical protein ACJ73_09020 [Blastomyces percursus]
MDIATAMTTESFPQSFVENGIEPSSYPPVDQHQYHEVVLQIPSGETEEDVEKELISIAQGIGLETSNAIHPQFDMSRFANHFPNQSSHFNLESSPLTSTSCCYANNNNASSPPTISSSNEIAGSMYSTTSISTRPTSHGSVAEQSCISPVTTPGRCHRSSLSSVKQGSRERRVKFSSFRLSFGKFPNFRRRSAAAASSPTSPVWPETRSITPGLDHPQFLDSQSKLGNQTPQSSNNPSLNRSNNVDKRTMMQTLNCPQLRELRSVQEAQRDRYLAFREETLETLYLRHEESKSSKRREHEKVEGEVNDQNMQEANRLEELQLSAELDLIEELRRERQTLEMRIRHMEGYLSNAPQNSQSRLPNNYIDNNSNIQQPHRQVTQKDRDHLFEKYRERDRMDTLHISKIKVLRDTQERKYLETVSKQEKKAGKVAQVNENAFQNFVSRCDNETAAANAWFLSRKQHLKVRWMLEEAIVRKRLEINTGISYAPLPVISFSEEYSERPD